ncbi:MAG: hypothetical protein J3K34DRAFT_38776 [Monoraphidium minutum]|nr:MAG: hypothetical protein J3K34DRAFT_38776 [Monoraphidium minutum]
MQRAACAKAGRPQPLGMRRSLAPIGTRNGRVAVRAAPAGGRDASKAAEQAAVAQQQYIPEAVQEVQQPYMYQQQPGAPQQYYTAAPPMPPPYPAAAYGAPPAATGAAAVPWWVWMGAGIIVAKLMDFAQNLMKKGPQAMMTEMAMKQMMKGMNMPNMPPGGAPGASPFGAPGAPNFGPYGANNPFAPNFKPPVDTTATAVDKPGGADSGARGEKFAARAASPGGGKAEEKKAEAPKAAAANGTPVVEAEVKEPTSSSGASPFGGSGSGAASSSGAGAPGGGAGGFFTDVGGGGGSGAAPGEADVSQMTAMMEQMLRDPNMQKMLYPYLPEPMRNPDSIEWMLNTPEVRKQLEQTLAQSGMTMSPQMMQMMQQMDFSQDKVQQQFSELGLKPEDVISKVLENPELASGFANPKVQAAIFDISQNPMNVVKYQEDPEIMKVLEKVTELFSPQGQGKQ